MTRGYIKTGGRHRGSYVTRGYHHNWGKKSGVPCDKRISSQLASGVLCDKRIQSQLEEDVGVISDKRIPSQLEEDVGVPM